MNQAQVYPGSEIIPKATSALARQYTRNVILVTPLYFGIAHIHHFYEFRLTHPHASIVGSVVRVLFQFTYTTVFGWFEAYVFVRTGSLLAVILAHSFCNWLGLPRFWGRVGQDVYVKRKPAAVDRLVAESQGLRSAAANSGLSRSAKSEKAYESQATAGAEGSLLTEKHNGGLAPIERAPPPLTEQMGLGVAWTVAYYVLLVVGAVGFYKFLGPLTESKNKLAEL